MLTSRAHDWFRQAIRDLEHAKKSLAMGDYEWACFASHQAAEKAVKALYQELGIEIWGHSVSKMLESLPEEHKPEESLINLANELRTTINNLFCLTFCLLCALASPPRVCVSYPWTTRCPHTRPEPI